MVERRGWFFRETSWTVFSNREFEPRITREQYRGGVPAAFSFLLFTVSIQQHLLVRRLEAVDKRAFIKAVRNWESRTVAAAVANDQSLARHVDKIGKTPLHHCAEIDPKKFGLRVSEAIVIAKALLDAGADVNAVRIITAADHPVETG